MATCLDCVICAEQFKQPVMVPCGHTFCLNCIQQCVNNERVHCPLCNTLHKVRGGRADIFPINYTVIGLVSDIKVSDNSGKTIELCQTHKKALELYCESCELPICIICIAEHDKHDLKVFEQKALVAKEQIEEELNKLTCFCDQICDIMTKSTEIREIKRKNAEETRNKLCAIRNETVGKIDKHYNELSKQIDQDLRLFEIDYNFHSKDTLDIFLQVADEVERITEFLKQRSDHEIFRQKSDLLESIKSHLKVALMPPPKTHKFSVLQPKGEVNVNKECADIITHNLSCEAYEAYEAYENMAKANDSDKNKPTSTWSGLNFTCKFFKYSCAFVFVMLSAILHTVLFSIITLLFMTDYHFRNVKIKW